LNYHLDTCEWHALDVIKKKESNCVCYLFFIKTIGGEWKCFFDLSGEFVCLNSTLLADESKVSRLAGLKDLWSTQSQKLSYGCLLTNYAISKRNCCLHSLKLKAGVSCLQSYDLKESTALLTVYLELITICIN